jgi:hypothetical protein
VLDILKTVLHPYSRALESQTNHSILRVVSSNLNTLSFLIVTEKYVEADLTDLYIKRVENSELFEGKENARFAYSPLALRKTSKRVIELYKKLE